MKKPLITPASRYATVIGRSMASGVRATFQALIILPIALIIGVQFTPNSAYFVLAFVIIFFAYGGFAAIGQAIIMPLFFASNALYPAQLMPPILIEFSTFNPLSYVVDAVRGLLIAGDLSNLLIDLLAIAIFDIVLFILASVSFKRIVE